jgi:hypothetical protein
MLSFNMQSWKFVERIHVNSMNVQGAETYVFP